MAAALITAALLAAVAIFFAHSAAANPPKHTNRLARETSPYLLQHAHNPVDWYPWGKEAFEAAKRHDKPIFLSVGYSTCHWCHVMAHESFEDEQVAAVMNEHFICIKVDREELPDVDEQYMLATQLMTRRGGWPNSVVLTPDGRPWFAGTYFPKDRFIPLLQELARVWKEQRPDVEEQANRLSEAIRQVASGRGDAARTPPLSPAVVDRAVQAFRGGYDGRHGGFGDRPKFPPHGVLAVMLENQQGTHDLGDLSIITHTLDAMSLGGIYDHVGGGFHRYSTDSRWFLPHFEKMLYDNAQLIRAYALAYKLTEVEDYKRVIAETFDWLEREMIDPAGGFYSALDADSEGEEGKFYVWSYQQALELLGAEEGELFARTYNLTREGNYREEATGHPTGTNIPYLSQPLPDDAAVRQRLAGIRGKLLAARNKRIRPHLDDKVLTSWNGLMIAALAYAGRELDEPRYIEAAAAAADFVLKNLRKSDGRLLRTWRKGEAKLPGYLDDYAFFIDGLLELHQSTLPRGQGKGAASDDYLEAARALAEMMIAEFYDPKNGGFYSTSGAHDELLIRVKEVGAGGNIPSGNGVAADVLLRLALETGEDRYASLAAQTLRHFGYLMWSQPHGSESLILALSRYYAAANSRPELRLAQRLGSTRKTDADAVAGDSPVRVEAYASRLEVEPGGTFQIALRIHMDAGYHIYAHNVSPRTMLTPTTVDITVPSTAEGWKIGKVRWPDPKTIADPVLKSEIPVYEGIVTSFVALTVPHEFSDENLDLRIVFKAQACDDKACYPPVDYTLTIPITIRPGAKVEAPRHPEIFKLASPQAGDRSEPQ